MASIASDFNILGQQPNVAISNQWQSDAISEQNGSTISKTHQIGIGIIICGVVIAAAVIAGCALTGVGVVAIVTAIVPLSVVISLKTGAIAGAVIGLVLTPFVLYWMKSFVL